MNRLEYYRGIDNLEELRSYAIFDLEKHIHFYSTSRKEQDAYEMALNKCKTKNDLIEFLKKIDLELDPNIMATK